MKDVGMAVCAGVAAVVVALLAAACSGGDGPSQEQPMTEATIDLTSPAFSDGADILTRHTCDGEDLSPPLRWSGVPENTRSLALIADDPDAPGGTFVHWVVYGLPPDTTELPEGVSPTDAIPQGVRQGMTDFGRVGYGGPCPPPGGPHRYYFKLYALDTELDLGGRATKDDLLRAMEGHVLAEGQLVGRYQRQ